MTSEQTTGLSGPTDKEIVAAVHTADAEDRGRLRAALQRIDRVWAAGDPLVSWSAPRGDGSVVGAPVPPQSDRTKEGKGADGREGIADNPHALPYPTYDDAVWTLIGALIAVQAQPVFAWMSWSGGGRYRTVGDVAAAPLADVPRLITSIVRGERFGDGMIAAALDSGVLIAAAERIGAELGCWP